MKHSAICRKAIIESEGLEYTMYLDSKKYPTIGIGHRIKENEKYLLTITLTDDQVNDIFMRDMAYTETWINKNCIWEKPIKQYEFDALCCFLHQYHIEDIQYRDTKAALIKGDRQQIINQMMLFRNINAGSGDNKLIPRRQREIAMFKGIYPSSVTSS